jgi:glucose/arabinose dehydrogenase/PKD repeat protein
MVRRVAPVRRVRQRYVSGLLACIAALLAGRDAMALPPNFTETVVFQGLTRPTAVRFSPDGRVFVAEKSGLIKVFGSLFDTTPTIVADLTTNVHDFWDRGLLGFALDPAFPVRPYVYVLYTYDYDPFDPTRPAPRWGDTCPDKDADGNIIGPGATVDGCVVNGRLSRLKVNPDNTLDGGEQVVLENNWCQQFPSHSMGSLVFGPEGALYVSAGDGASFNTADWGQFGGTRGTPPYTPANPCGDPNRPRGTATQRLGAEGGGLRAQDLRTSGDPQSWNGDILRIDPDTGAAWPTNPLVGNGVPDDDPIIAFGLRNPFRMTQRPGMAEIWIGDVGWNTWEEIDRIINPEDSLVENFGWPCVEGSSRPLGYNFLVSLCSGLETASTVAPYYQYLHNWPLYSGDPCSTTSGSSISGLAFYSGGSYPPVYNGALFFADYSRNCVFVMTPGAHGNPDVATRTAFLTGVADSQQIGDPLPVDLEIGPGGDLFLVDIDHGQVRRISYNAANTPPAAIIQATPDNGPAPLQVSFDAGGSSDPDPGSTLYFAWDLDGDGVFDNGNLSTASWTYDQPGNYTARLRVTDDDGAATITTKMISAGNTAPVASIDQPTPALTWRVGDVIAFSGQGWDANDGALGPGAMHWEIVLHHCEDGPDTCHDHLIETHDGIDHGTFTAPDHEYYSELVFVLTVTDSGGLTDTRSVTLVPLAVTDRFDSAPQGLTLLVNASENATPFLRPSIIGSSSTITAATPQLLGDDRFYFVSWDDGNTDPTRTYVAEDVPQSFSAVYAPCVAVETTCDGLDNNCDGIIDNVPPPAGIPELRLDAAGLAWSAVPGAQAYDVLQGHLLPEGGSPFTDIGTDACLAAAAASTSLPVTTDPAPGAGFWFLVRARNCGGAGSYDSAGAGQAGSRDAGLAGATAACP